MKTKTTKRFDNAVTKLYNAFHNGTLNALDCRACAVGNMCNNSVNWGNYGTEKWGNVSQEMVDTGYSHKELRNIEMIFMFGVMPDGRKRFQRELGDGKGIETNFKGLCCVVEYLCELDGIKNVMGYTSLFETENEKPKKQLIEILN